MGVARKDQQPRALGISREIVALCIGNAVGFAGTGTMPIWVGAIIKAGPLSTIEVGWLASAESFSLAISVLAVSAWLNQTGPRRVAVIAACLVVAANCLAMLSIVSALIIGRLLSGIAMGALLASVTKVAARHQDAQRVLALMTTAMVILVSGVYFASSTLIGRFGAAGLFGVFAVCGAGAALASIAGLPSTATAAESAARRSSTARLAPLLGSLALAVVFIGQGSVWTYIIIIGNGLGIDGRTLAIVLALVLPLATVGPVAAHALGERVGLLWPLVISLVVLSVAAFLLVWASSPTRFCIHAAILNAAILFCVPYAIALLSRLDASARFAGAAPAFMMIGGSIGPVLGSKALDMSSFRALPFIVASCVAVAIVLFLAAARIGGIKMSLREIQAGRPGPSAE
jgi:predicted MFS family arabinose efflux permease